MIRLALLFALAFVTEPAEPATKPNLKGNLAILDEGQAICGAVLLSSQTVLTAAHCVDENAALEVRCLGSDIPAEVVARDADEDIATLDLMFPCGAPTVEIAKADPPMGEDVYALGFPTSSARMSRGIVSGYEVMNLPPYDQKQHKPKVFLATDTAIDPGSSGGGLFDESGKLVGICSMVRGNFGYFVPPHRITKFLGRK
jgi:serine protease Do